MNVAYVAAMNMPDMLDRLNRWVAETRCRYGLVVDLTTLSSLRSRTFTLCNPRKNTAARIFLNASCRALALFITFTCAATAAARPLTLGVVPQESPLMLVQDWAPIVRALSERTKLRIVLKTTRDIPTFEKRVRDGAYDIVYINPQDYVIYNRTTGYRAIACARGITLQGVLVVRRGAPYRTLTDLANKTLAFPAPRALAASVIPRSVLRHYHIPFNAKYVGSHDSVYLGVARGLFVAGGGVEQTLNASSVRRSLRVLWRSERFPPHPFAVLTSVPNTTAQRIVHALIDIGHDPTLRPALKRLGFPGFKATNNAAYDPLRRLNTREE